MAQFRDLIVTGPSRFLGNVFLSGSLEIGSSLSVLGDIEGTGDLAISGNGEFLDGLRVYTPNSGGVLAEFSEDDTGALLINLGVGNTNIELHGNSFILDANTATINSVNTTNITSITNNITGATNIIGTTNITGTLSTSDRITVSAGGVGIVGDSSISGENIVLTGTTKIDLTGATNITGNTGITGTLTSSGLITGSNGLVVNGAESTFNKSVTISGSSSNLTVGGTLTVAGLSKLNGGISFDGAADSITWGSNAGIVAGSTQLILAPGSSITAANGLSLTSSDIKWKGYSLLTTNNYGNTLNSKYIQKDIADKTTGKVNFNGGIGFSDNKGTIAWDATAQALVVSFS